MTEETEGIHLFSNGFEFDVWQGVNCNGCVKQPTCDLYDAIFTDPLTHGVPHGSVTQETAELLGYTSGYLGVLRWPCKARQIQGHEHFPKPAAHEVSSAGGTMLPGMEDVAVRPDERKYPS